MLSHSAGAAQPGGAIEDAVAERVPVAWVRLDADGRIEWHNTRFASLLGRIPGLPLTGDLFNALLAPASQVYFDLGVLPSMLLGQHLGEVHLMLRLANGQELPVLCYGAPEAGSRVSLAVLPIPERRRLESDLISVRNAVEQVPGAVFQLSQAAHGRLRCVYFSGDALTLLGVSRPQLHKALWKLMAREVRRGFARTMAAAAANFSLFHFDIPIPERQGSGTPLPRWLHIQARAQLQSDGRRVWFGHIMDVSQLKRAEAALQASEQRYRSLAEASPIGIFHADSQGRCLFANAGWREIFSIEDAAARWLDCVAEPERSQLSRALSERESPPAAFELEFRVAAKSGEIRFVRLNARRLRGPAGQHDGYVGTVEDISERRAMERALTENHELLRVTMESIGEAVITTDIHGRVRWINPVAERMSGWNTLEAFGRPLEEVLPILDPLTLAPAENVALSCVRDGALAAHSGDRTLMPNVGGDLPTILTIEQSVAPIRSASGEVLGAVVLFHDVTAQREQSRVNERLAAEDVLTRMYNRNRFNSDIERLLRQPQLTGNEDTLLFIDLDQFKLINDACGHAEGDRALANAAEQIKDVLREAGVKDRPYRIGGDEFAILLKGSGQSGGERIGAAICARMEHFRFVFKDRPFRLGASIGLVVIDERWRDVTSLLQAADTACYAAKEAGRNRVQAWLDGDRVQLRRMGEMQWAARVAEALDENRMELFAQRIEPTQANAEPLHCELLLRLREPDGTMVTPAAFIGAAERFHMASRIDRWVIRRALDILGSTAGRQADVASVSINVSGQSIADPVFRADLKALLAAAAGRVDPGQLCFEITETVLASNPVDAVAFMHDMHELGSGIAIDDFGAEHATFGPIKKMASEDLIDYLKIDGEFIKDGFANAIDGVAVRFFQELARTIGARTVAEWVPDDTIRRQLGDIGIDFVQGFVIHRPEPFLDLLRKCTPRQPAAWLPG